MFSLLALPACVESSTQIKIFKVSPEESGGSRPGGDSSDRWVWGTAAPAAA